MLTLCLSFFACGKKGSKSDDTPFFSLEELVSDPEFQQIFADNEDEYFKTTVSASGTVLLFRVDAKKTYEGEDLDFFRNLTTEEILDKFGLEDLRKTLKAYGFGDVTIEYKMYNGDGALITERTLD